MAKDIRRHRRVPLPGVVRVSWQDSGGNPRFANGRCIDLSASGMRLEMPEPVPLRSYVSVSAPKLGIVSNASVRHCARSGGKCVVGLEFSSALNVKDPRLPEDLRQPAEPQTQDA